MRTSKEIECELRHLESQVSECEAKQRDSESFLFSFFQKEIDKLARRISYLYGKLDEVRRREKQELELQESIQYAILGYDAYFYINQHVVAYIPTTGVKKGQLELCSLFIFATLLATDGAMPSSNKDRVIRAFSQIDRIRA